MLSSSTLDVGSPYDQKSDLVCGATLQLWGTSYSVSCAQIPKTVPTSVDSTEYALVHDGTKTVLLTRLNDNDGWWCNLRVVGDEAFFTFRFHKLD